MVRLGGGDGGVGVPFGKARISGMVSMIEEGVEKIESQE